MTVSKTYFGLDKAPFSWYNGLMTTNKNTFIAFDMSGQRVNAQVNVSSDFVTGDKVKGDKIVVGRKDPKIAVTFAYGVFIPRRRINANVDFILHEMSARMRTSEMPTVISVADGYVVTTEYSVSVGEFRDVPSLVTDPKDAWDEAQTSHEISEFLKENDVAWDSPPYWFYIVTVL